MKKTLMILGGIFAVLIILGVIGFVVLSIKGTSLDKESKAYVDEVSPIILANLNRGTLFQYASEDLKNSASIEEFGKIFSWLSKLGQFKKYNGSQGQAHISVTTKSGKKITGYYEAQDEFESGPAKIRITTVKEGDDWKVVGFFINSMALANE
jgi:hypothetical protein